MMTEEELTTVNHTQVEIITGLLLIVADLSPIQSQTMEQFFELFLKVPDHFSAH